MVLGGAERRDQHPVDRALEFLRRRQGADGEFVAQLWRVGRDPATSVRDRSVFITACVLYALRHVPAGQDMAGAAVGFLIREMRAPGVWSYWTAASGKRIDPDLDDTALISFLLKRHHPHIALGSNVEAILAARDDAGLFRTWIRPGCRPNDVDAVVNANVVLHLGERPETAAACAFLRECVRAGAGSYWYYVDDSALHYAVSRAAFHGVGALRDVQAVLVARALERQQTDGSFGDELCTAWTISTLVNAEADGGDAVARAVAWLLARQRAHGGWRCVPAFTGPEPPGPRLFLWGSEELTTAACVEALARVATRPQLL